MDEINYYYRQLQISLDKWVDGYPEYMDEVEMLFRALKLRLGIRDCYRRMEARKNDR
ncbi:hypothetical protein QP248_02770 [Aerococcus sp. UMB8608]|uniref:hypothetical protein n=1 Tax=Aerococcus TaxID=1375 RepID=UPI00130EF5E0|nr:MULTISPECIES: hypothetical protein [Aerococcus]MDK6679373.1 hypothetical protein [Aerococcus sp. UMB8608]MDK6685785.1 hypothetical protein [Aerococcus sp. UMB8623]